MPTPSLVNIPFITAPNVLFSQIPESGAGDFTVTRATTPDAGRSTRVNAAGLIELVPDNIARLDYPLGGGCPALLVEPSAINICLRSTWVGGGAVPTGWSSFITGTSTPITSLLGNDSVAYSFLATSQRAFFSQAITISNATNYTFSFYVESITTGLKIDEIALFVSGASSIVFVDPDGITILATTVISKTGRYQVRMLSTSTSTEIRVGVGVSNATTASFVLSRPQLEVGSVATSYVPTTTAAVTRSAEIISNTSATALIGQTEGTIYMEVNVKNLGFARNYISVQDTSYAGNAFRIEQTTNNQWRVQIRAATVSVLDRTIVSPTVTNGIYKIAFAYNTATNGTVFAVNGAIISTDTVTTMPSGVDRVILGSRLISGNFDLLLNDRISAHSLYPNRLSNVDLVNITAPAGSFWWGINMPTKLWGTATNEIWG